MSDHLTRASRVAVLALLVFLLASLLATVERNLELQRDNKRVLASLAETNRGIVEKLTDVFATAQRAEDAARAAGMIPEETVASIVASLKGYVDPALVEKAVDAARKAVAGQRGPAGPPGPPGPAGAAAATPSSTVPATSTTRPAPTTTSSTTTTRRPTTTTTRPCTLGLLGACLVR